MVTHAIPSFAPKRRPRGRPLVGVKPRGKKRVVPVRKPDIGTSHAKHPWDKWFRKGRFVLRRGVHYFNRTSIMAQQARNYASRCYNNIKLSIQVSPDEQSMTVTVMELSQCQ